MSMARNVTGKLSETVGLYSIQFNFMKAYITVTGELQIRVILKALLWDRELKKKVYVLIIKT